ARRRRRCQRARGPARVAARRLWTGQRRPGVPRVLRAGDAGVRRGYHAGVVHPQIQEIAMYRRILVAYDGSPESRLAVDECVHLTLQPERHIHLACVLHDPSPYLLAGEFVPAPTLEIDRTRSEKDLKEAAARLTERGFTVTTHLLDGEPVEVITRLVNTLHIDLLIVGHKRS